MIGVLGHDSALLSYTGPETTWANEMNILLEDDVCVHVCEKEKEKREKREERPYKDHM